MGGGQNSLTNLRDSPFKKIYQMRPLLAWSILLDSTFKKALELLKRKHYSQIVED